MADEWRKDLRLCAGLNHTGPFILQTSLEYQQWPRPKGYQEERQSLPWRPFHSSLSFPAGRIRSLKSVLLPPPSWVVFVQSLSHVQLFATRWTVAHQASLSFTISRSWLKLMSMSQWCHPAISSSFVPFSSCPQSFPASGSSPVSQLFTSGGQSIGASASASVLSVNIQSWFLLGLGSSCRISGAHRTLLFLPQASNWISPPPGVTCTTWGSPAWRWWARMARHCPSTRTRSLPPLET